MFDLSTFVVDFNSKMFIIKPKGLVSNKTRKIIILKLKELKKTQKYIAKLLKQSKFLISNFLKNTNNYKNSKSFIVIDSKKLRFEGYITNRLGLSKQHIWIKYITLTHKVVSTMKQIILFSVNLNKFKMFFKNLGKSDEILLSLSF